MRDTWIRIEVLRDGANASGEQLWRAEAFVGRYTLGTSASYTSPQAAIRGVRRATCRTLAREVAAAIAAAQREQSAAEATVGHA
jgi:hypothetical protein